MRVQVRFPNDDQYFDIEIERMSEFKPKKEFKNSIFGWWGDICRSSKGRKRWSIHKSI